MFYDLKYDNIKDCYIAVNFFKLPLIQLKFSINHELYFDFDLLLKLYQNVYSAWTINSLFF